MQSMEVKKKELDFRTKEAYKTLRTNISFSGSDIKVVAFTSCTPGEGKSSVSFEIAKAFAENGERVLLIDADLRKSVMRQRYKRGKIRLGLMHCLVRQCSLQDAVCATDIPNFYMLFAGPTPPNPSELLGSAEFEAILREARLSFDMVIVDTPPLGSVIDAAVISKHCDGTVIVVSSGAVSYRFVRKIQEQLEKANSKILGMVLNKVDLSGKGYYGKYYGKYYGEYYGNY